MACYRIRAGNHESAIFYPETYILFVRRVQVVRRSFLTLRGLALAEDNVEQLKYEIDLVLPMILVSGILMVVTRGKLGVEEQID
jgi:hypothetical protein